jgi:hypothetical protein
MAGRKPGVKFGGRKKGTPNKHKKEHRESLREFCARIGVDPHRYMAELIADTSEIVYGVDAQGLPIVGPAVKVELKLNAAKELAQYLEPKLKSVEHGGGLESTVNHIIEVTLE